jgi:DNA-binding phage protein
MPTSRSYHSYLIESLKDSQEAAAYLDAVLEEGNYDELLLALRNVAEARIASSGESQIALNQEIVQKFLSPQTNRTYASRSPNPLKRGLSSSPFLRGAREDLDFSIQVRKS